MKHVDFAYLSWRYKKKEENQQRTKKVSVLNILIINREMVFVY